MHFPPPDVPLETLNAFRSPAHQRLIFEEFFFYQLSLALRRQQAQRLPGIAFRVREPQIREALKRILPFKPTDAQKRVLAEIAADLERPVPMNRLLEGDVGSGKTIVAFEAAAIVIENGWQVALMAPTEILAVQHFLSARRIFAPVALYRRNDLERTQSSPQSATWPNACAPVKSSSWSARTPCSKIPSPLPAWAW